MNELIQVKFNEEVVITTKMLAEVYECDTNNISVNFKANKDKFIEGKHYYKVEGEELKNLRMSFPHLQISPKTRTLYLWTKRGASRHCKMLGTDKAWDMFDVLEENYFNVKPQIDKKQQLQLAILNGDDITKVLALREYEEVITAPLLKEIEELAPKSEAYDKWYNSNIKYNISDLAHCVEGMPSDKQGGHIINEILVEEGILIINPAWEKSGSEQRRCMTHYIIAPQYYGKKYAYIHTGTSMSTGYAKQYKHLKWTPKGIILIFDILEKRGYKVDRNTLCDELNK